MPRASGRGRVTDLLALRDPRVELIDRLRRNRARIRAMRIEPFRHRFGELARTLLVAAVEEDQIRLARVADAIESEVCLAAVFDRLGVIRLNRERLVVR